MSRAAPGAARPLRAWLPGAFVQLGPRLGREFTGASGQPVDFAPFRPSGLLAQSILAGEPADVYVSANVVWMRRLQRAGLVRHWSTLARNRLCLIARPDVAIASLADLACPGLVVVAPQAQTDPCGRYIEQLWRRTGLLPPMRAKQANGQLVRSVGSGDLPSYVLDGRAEVGMFYLSEARQLADARVRTIELGPAEDMHERIRFVVGALTAHGQPLVDWLLADEAQAMLSAAGFLTQRGGTHSWRAREPNVRSTLATR